MFCITGCASVEGASAPIITPKPIKSISAINPKQLTVQQTAIPPVQPQPVDFGHCSSTFKIDSQKLFYLTLASANANRFKIDEVQSKSGYVLFTVAQRQFLASVISVNSQTSMLKITPCNNIYYFPIGIVQNMFKYIELNLATPIEKLSVL